MEKTDLVILCGGRGSRLKYYTNKTHKPLLKINGITFLNKIINYYQKLDLNKIYLLAGYKGKLIKKYYDNKIFNLISTKVIVEKKPLGTAGSLNLIKKKVKNNFILVNGDSYVEYDIINFIKKKKSVLGKILLVDNINYKSNSKLTNLSVKNDIVTNTKKKGKMNAGVYLFDRRIFKLINKNFQSLEDEILPILIKNKKISGELTNGYFIDIGTIKNLNLAKSKFFKKKSALFLDRDGVINKDKGYVHKMKDFEWTKNVFKALKFSNNKFDHLFIVTNQSGIGRGLYSEKTFINFHKKIKKILTKKKIFIDEIFYCPHHPIYGLGKYKKKCKCRKPNNLMLEKAIKFWNINRLNSLMIGDKKTDKLCAKKSKINFMYKKKDIFKQINEFI